MSSSSAHSFNPDNAPLLSSEEVAAKLNVSSRCVLNWLYGGIISAPVRVGKVIRFREKEVITALQKASEPRSSVSSKREIIHLALWCVAPDAVDKPSCLSRRDPTPEEEELALQVATFFQVRMEELRSPELRMGYAKGVMAMACLEEQGFWEK